MKLYSRIMLLCALISAIGFAPQLRAATGCACTLVWDGSPSPGITGYAIYYGVSGSSITNRFDSGLALTATISGLTPSTPYFFYVVGYDAFDDESPPSNELLFSTPPISPLQLRKLNGGLVMLQFRVSPGAACHVEYTESLDSPTWTLLGTGVGNTTGLVRMIDTIGGSGNRFYRASVP